MEIQEIITLVLSALAIFAGGFWLKAKGKIAQLKTVITELTQLITALSAALEDDKISKKELENLKKEKNEVFKAVGDLFS